MPTANIRYGLFFTSDLIIFSKVLGGQVYLHNQNSYRIELDSFSIIYVTTEVRMFVILSSDQYANRAIVPAVQSSAPVFQGGWLARANAGWKIHNTETAASNEVVPYTQRL